MAPPALAEPPPAPARASASPQAGQAALAEALFQEGLRLGKAGKLEEACPKFAASQKAVPSYGAAFNLGACHSELGRTASAWAAFSEAEPLARDATERAEARDRIDALSKKLVRVRVAVTDPSAGVTVTWDGEPLDRAAWDTPVPVDPGAHRIEATAPGKRPWSSAVQATREGETLAVTVPLLADEGASSRWPVQRTIGLVVGAFGLAGLGAGGVLGALASSKWDEAKKLCHYPDDTCVPPGAAMGNEARSLAHGSTAAFIAGGALVAAGVVLIVTAKSPAVDASPPSVARVSPWIAPTGAGATAVLSF